MPTAHEQVLDALASLLSTAAVVVSSGTVNKPTGLAVGRAYLRPREGTREMIVKAAPEMALQMERGPGGQIRCELLVDVECRAEGDPPETAVDDLVRWAHVAPLSDPTLEGWATDVVPVAVGWEGMRGEKDEAAAVVRLRVTYFVAMDDPTVSRS